MSFWKRIFGFLLIFFAFLLIILLGMPQFYSNNPSGRIDKEVIIQNRIFKNENAAVVVLYFGYLGCDTICTPALSELAEIQKKVDSNNLQIYFVQLSKNPDDGAAELFAKHFHDAFKSLHLTQNELQYLTQTLGVNYTLSITNQEINHAGYLYVFSKEDNGYMQRFIYTARPYHQQSIVDDITQLLQRK